VFPPRKTSCGGGIFGPSLTTVRLFCVAEDANNPRASNHNCTPKIAQSGFIMIGLIFAQARERGSINSKWPVSAIVISSTGSPAAETAAA
jgi:hypothetical protein